MKYFQTLFTENHSNTVEYDGVTYHRFWPVQVNGVVKFKLRFVQSRSQFKQAIVLSFPSDFAGAVFVMGHNIPIRKSAFPALNFWEDTAPNEFEVVVTNFFGELKICNGSDPLGSKQFCKHLSEGCAMIVQHTGGLNYRFSCHDHEYGGTCDNLVFELEIIG